MGRQRRSALKITDYRKYHLSGDLDQVVQGKVSEVVVLLEGADEHTMTSTEVLDEQTPKQLQELLKIQTENSTKLQQQAETMKL